MQVRRTPGDLGGPPVGIVFVERGQPERCEWVNTSPGAPPPGAFTNFSGGAVSKNAINKKLAFGGALIFGSAINAHSETDQDVSSFADSRE
jgi:hypothetical protein